MNAGSALLLAVSLVSAAHSAPLKREDVPAPLVPWIPWVLHGHEGELCPFLQGRGEEKPCAWPGGLTLELGEKGGRFSSSWRVYAQSWVALPGDAQRWPQELRVDGAPAAAVLHDGAPALLLKPGNHSVAGAFTWDAAPEILRVPPETGMVGLSVSGRAVAFPVRDEQGRLWLHRAAGPDREESHLAVSVHRKVVDDVPLLLVTSVQLRVSGKNREVVLGKALPQGFVPLALHGPLPARVEPDGRLRVQARAGTWTLELTARHQGPAAAITAPEPGGPWDSDEAWTFEARNDLRMVNVEGPPPVDPNQTELPPAWRRLPAFLMKPGDTMRLAQRRRGDADPQPDRLTLARELWLDFDGRGLTARDSISGTLSRSWRLEMGPETRLGRASIAGVDQFITSLKEGGPAGVEVREGQVSVSGESRIERRPWKLPAVSWNHDFEGVSGSLHLPPGWRLLHAWGVDKVSPSWVSSWTLLDIFLVLMISLAVGRLWDRRWGLAALAGAVLAWHEPLALRWIWLAVLACEALHRALPEGNFRRAAGYARSAGWGLAVLFAVPFLISQVRNGLFPQLEPRWAGGGFGGRALLGSLAGGAASVVSNATVGAAMDTGTVGAAPEPPSEPELSAEGSEAVDAEAMEESDAEEPQQLAMNRAAQMEQRQMSAQMAFKGGAKFILPGVAGSRSRLDRGYAALKQNLALDPKSEVSTGPGLPTWEWRTTQLTWRGPVDKGQRLRLWLVSPRQRLVLSLLRVGLTTLLLLLLFGLPVGAWLAALREPGGWRRTRAWLLPALLALLAPPAPAEAAPAGDLPTPEMLTELRARLLAPPDCSPNCAEIPRLRLEVTAGWLAGRMEVHAGAATALPVPGGVRQWVPTRLLLDGNPAALRREADGSLWLATGPGSHQVLFEGPLPDAESVSIALPLKPRRVEASVSGWTLHGLGEDGQAEENLSLSRTRGGARPSEAAQGVLPPFVRVTRTLELGLSWQITTRVDRLSPPGAPIVLDVPLLAGESVTSDLRVKDGKVQVSMPPSARSAAWTSVLEQGGKIELKASPSPAWVEAWRLELGPVWHAEAEGIPPVHREPPAGARVREWRPWPGEAVTLSVIRPAGVPGRTLTLDHAGLVLTPGLRASDARLSLRLRSSRGGNHVLELPEGAELQSVTLDGEVQPVRQEGTKVSLPIQPGAHSAELAWRQPRGIRLFYRTPVLGLGGSAVNAELALHMPADRWTLFVGGPRLGPAVLFWSLLAVYALVSVGLGRLGPTPLGWRQWFLLSIGLSQLKVVAAAVVALWLVALGWRKRSPAKGEREFDLLQLFLAFLTLLALACLFRSITRGLLGLPDMQIGGNGSSAQMLRWYQDRTGETLPRAWALSVPLGVYRLAMLAWALWLAHSLLGWLKWGWQCFAADGLWRPLSRPKPERPPEQAKA